LHEVLFNTPSKEGGKAIGTDQKISTQGLANRDPGSLTKEFKMMPRIFTNLILILVFGLVSTVGAEEVPSDYRLGDGDIVRILVYDHPDLTTTSRITSGGMISIPLIGSVRIDGMTVSQVAREISKQLSDGYVVNPQVSVFVEEFRSKRAIILGQVVAPGTYEMTGPTSLVELISKAGGLRPEAGEHAVIKRKSRSPQESEQQITINLRDLVERGDASLDIQIVEGDTVFISEAGIFYVTGEVNRPAAYRLEPDTSVIKAITMAGGFTNLASKRRVQIIRQVDGAEQVLKKVPMNEKILPNDVIVVPESFF
jgi:polysaccharide biosynthesis/export protein